MTAKIFCGPGEYVFPMYVDPRGSGTLVATPGEVYDFGNENPPGSPDWWADPAPAVPAARVTPGVAPAPPPAAPVAPATDTATGQEG